MPIIRKRAGGDVSDTSTPKRVVRRAQRSKTKSNPTGTPDVQEIKIRKVSRTKKTDQAKTQAQVAPPEAETVAQSEPTVHIAVADITPVATRVLMGRNALQLALLSPFRYPIDSNRLASQVARYAGVFFVVLGAIFTVLNMEYIGLADTSTRNLSQSAQLVSSTVPTTGDCTTLATGCDTSTGSGGSTVNTKPAVDVVIDAPSPYKNTIPINIYVPDAQNVTLYTYSKSGQTSIPLGQALSVSAGQWRYYWNTTLLSDGEYRLKMVITNRYGVYDHSESSYVLIENHPIADTTTTEQTTTPTTGGATGTSDTGGTTGRGTTASSSATSTSDTSTSTTPPTIKLDTGGTILKDTATIKILVKGATRVKMFAYDQVKAVQVSLGYAVMHGDGEWRLEWDTKPFANGRYALKAEAVVTGSPYISSVYEISILNATEPVAVSTTTMPTSTTTAPIVQTLEPDITIKVSTTDPAYGDVDIVVSASGLMFVEMYALRENTLTPYFLGLAQKRSALDWKFTWRTRETPNGNYSIFARVKHSYGITDSKRVKMRVANETTPPPTTEQANLIKEIQDVGSALNDAPQVPETETTTVSEASTTGETPATTRVEPVSVTSIVQTIEVSDDTRDILEEELIKFREDIEDDLQKYAHAVRVGDTDEMARIKEDIEQLRNEAISTLPFGSEQAGIIAQIDQHLERIVAELEERTEKNETIIKERIGDKAIKDGDNDGLSDYDEVNLYNTNPFSADTDGDGFIDSTEILSGYDPLSSKPETLIAYESPKDVGSLREDILTVDTISTVADEIGTGSEDYKPKSAIISGKGLPNSYVTLYIFSTPIVVTVKTDANGTWSYIFDKELEEGNHEVYAGITDNAGRVVAKSSPFAFVKTAQAFTPVDAGAGATFATADTEPSLIDPHIMLVVASIAVVAIGLVLILLGLHIQTRREPELVLQ